MIYKTFYGDIEILPDSFLNTLDGSKKEIATRLSGGADTSLLLYLIAKEISERNLQFSIIPYMFLDIPDRFVNGHLIINFIRSSFPSVQIHDLLYNRDLEDNRNNRFTIDKEIHNKYNIAFSTNGVNKSPPIDIVGDDLYLKMNSSNTYRNNKHLDILNAPQYKPFEHHDKRLTYELYQILGLMDSLFPLTRSCLGNKIDTEYHLKPCKTCYWCKEKYWAFGQYDSISY